MSRFAALLMFVAWLLYGAMPAVGMPSMAPDQTMAAMTDHSDHGTMEGMAEATPAPGDMQQPCPLGGKICVTPFCAACLTLLPELAFGDNRKLVYAYPAPAIEQALTSPDPAPVTPPPRA